MKVTWDPTPTTLQVGRAGSLQTNLTTPAQPESDGAPPTPPPAPGQSPDGGGGEEKPSRLLTLATDVLVCGAVALTIHHLLNTPRSR